MADFFPRNDILKFSILWLGLPYFAFNSSSHLMFKAPTCSLPFLLFCSSCEEATDPALLAEFETNRIEIQRLELAVEKIGKQLEKIRIDDATPELESLKEKVEAERARKAGLQREVSALKDEKVEAAKKLSEYQQKYPVR